MTKFSDLKLDPKVLSAIADAGYETPTPIQQGAIPPALEGRDVLGIAQTGTGKTASFTLPMITLLGRGRARARMPRSLVLCPTRELAAQVAENFDTYAKNTRLTKALLIGGVSFGEQDKLIDRGVDVLIATPGRLLDHFERGKLLLTGVQIMVVDEADRMLDMGFIPDIERIFQLTPFTRQTLFFSATMAPEIERITSTFLHTPERIEVARQSSTSDTITQRLVELTPTRKDQTAKQKRELLRALIEAEGDKLTNAIIFCNRKTDVDIVAKSLKKHGFDAAPIHGDLDQSQRMRTLDGFRDGSLRLLVASDVAARGLDIPAVSHVFNHDLPSHAEDYVHRIGRTGRAGREGTAISIATPSDEKYLSAIENLVKATLPRAELPAGFSLSEAAQGAPRAGSRGNGRSDRGSDRGRGGRGRSRRDDNRRDDAPRDEGTRTEAPRPESTRPESTCPEGQARDNARHDTARADTSGAETRREDRRDDRRDDNRRDDRRSDRRDDSRRDDRRNGRNRGDRGDVLGMGDHVPEFLTRSFLPEDLPPVAEPDTTDEAAPAADAGQPEAATPDATTRKRSRTRRRKPEAEAESPAAPVAAQDADQPEAATAPEGADQPETEKAPQDAPEVAAKKPVRKRASRAKKPAADAAPKAAGDATAQPDAPAADAVSDAQPEAAEAPKKPARKRASRAKKAVAEAPEAVTAASSDAADSQPGDTPDAPASDATAQDAAAAKPAPKPRARRTRKPKTAEAPADSASADAQAAPAADQAAPPANGDATPE